MRLVVGGFAAAVNAARIIAIQSIHSRALTLRTAR
jgi:hypothetical protein